MSLLGIPRNPLAERGQLHIPHTPRPIRHLVHVRGAAHEVRLGVLLVGRRAKSVGHR
eukprot:CAMPEP_0172556694 /NCGR_PEP_ID=MMETSP1067-20121228/68327_1 /TAXON_ID=265564 ORGANISM="Thalassiosira punctigera, Strain Tpunct2005C2" /NCGR_SAMPLE_ID=MMETSP1067 /ASSEMBLY_ACC=CAM_ASM_000444 /LENGTH=56 /DNA_ID=CAMNT_0013345569 /DNA_START=17 /DNA_END=184 /DNA_ORIENTATION=+